MRVAILTSREQDFFAEELYKKVSQETSILSPSKEE